MTETIELTRDLADRPCIYAGGRIVYTGTDWAKAERLRDRAWLDDSVIKYELALQLMGRIVVVRPGKGEGETE